jgi:hypothetical protein
MTSTSNLRLTSQHVAACYPAGDTTIKREHATQRNATRKSAQMNIAKVHQMQVMCPHLKRKRNVMGLTRF